jgi:hypothetical protein
MSDNHQQELKRAKSAMELSLREWGVRYHLDPFHHNFYEKAMKTAISYSHRVL